MLLKELTREEKNVFWNIACVLASVDGEVSEEEKLILKQYNEEMNVEFDVVEPASIDISSEIMMIKDNARRNLKIIYFELYGLAYSDMVLDERETRILDAVCKVFQITSEDRRKIEECVDSINSTYLKLGGVLND